MFGVRNKLRHIFFDKPENNTIQPGWFVDCSRDDAEHLLSLRSDDVSCALLRPHRTFSSTGNYAISLRAIRSDGSRSYHHFNVIKCDKGYVVDVTDKSPPISCLSNVMQYFQSKSTRRIDLYNDSTVEPVKRQEEDDYLNGITGTTPSDNTVHHYVNVHDYVNTSTTTTPHQTRQDGVKTPAQKLRSDGYVPMCGGRQTVTATNTCIPATSIKNSIEKNPPVKTNTGYVNMMSLNLTAESARPGVESVTTRRDYVNVISVPERDYDDIPDDDDLPQMEPPPTPNAARAVAGTLDYNMVFGGLQQTGTRKNSSSSSLQQQLCAAVPAPTARK